MIYINLLPVRKIRKRVQARSQIIGFCMVLLSLLGILGVIWVIQGNQIKQNQVKLQNLQQEKQKYDKILAVIKQLDADKELLEKQTKIIEQLHAASSLTVHVMDEVARLVPPERMWLETMAQNGSSLEITGMALDNQTVASFMEALRDSSYIQDVELNTASLKPFADRNLKSFSLRSTVVTPDQKKAQESQDKK